MAIDYQRLLDWDFGEIEHHYTEKDSILYALGLGLGADPLDEHQLSYVYEDNLQALPTLSVVLGYPGFWLKNPDTGVDWVKVLHGEQGIEIHNPLPASTTVVGRTRVTEIVDKGADKGALIYTAREVVERDSEIPLATLTSTTFARGDGGFGGPDKADVPPPPVLPDRDPDQVVDLPTLPQAALIYRLSGDFNPLHADPKVAQAAGFKAPILHGLGTLGVAGHALLRAVCDYDASRFKSLWLRFSAPVYPGETIRTEIWRNVSGEPEGTVLFRSKVVERDIVVLNNGRARVR